MIKLKEAAVAAHPVCMVSEASSPDWSPLKVIGLAFGGMIAIVAIIVAGWLWKARGDRQMALTLARDYGSGSEVFLSPYYEASSIKQLGGVFRAIGALIREALTAAAELIRAIGDTLHGGSKTPPA